MEELLCTACGRVTAAEGNVAAEDLAAAAREAGFVAVRHRLTVYGLCAECARARDREGATADRRTPGAGGR